MKRTFDLLFELFLECGKVCTDSRNVVPGSLFFALRGERFDGNAFAHQALDEGAAYAVVSDPALEGQRYIGVDDTLEALQALAKRYRRTFDIPLLAITGSNGKTTTKDLLGAVLSAHYRTHVTRGNLNNHIGVPLTLLNMPQSTELAVVEMGANHIGEIAALCDIASPTHGVITNIGKAHLAGFGGLEGVKKGKSELYTFLAEHNGTAFVNKRLDYLPELSSSVQKRIFYALGEVLRYSADDMEFTSADAHDGIEISFVDSFGKTRTVRSGMFGAYNAENFATAIAAGLFFGVESKEIAGRLSAYAPLNNRSEQLQRGNLTVILDAYNANPTSMQQALESFVRIPGERHVVLGDMRELGVHADEAHAAIIRLLESYDLTHVYLVGPHFSEVHKPDGFKVFPDVEALCKHLRTHPLRSGSLLVKGSRGIALERLLTVL